MSFWTSLRPRWGKKEKSNLPMSARITQCETDMHGMRSELDGMAGTLRKLSGKIYRGVSLGDTIEAAQAPTESVENPPPLMDPGKSDLYRQAAQLRGR